MIEFTSKNSEINKIKENELSKKKLIFQIKIFLNKSYLISKDSIVIKTVGTEVQNSCILGLGLVIAQIDEY